MLTVRLAWFLSCGRMYGFWHRGNRMRLHSSPTLNPTCDISGIIFTASNPTGAPFTYPNSLSNSTDVFFDDGDSNDDRFAESATVAAAQSDSPCKKNGNCKATIEIEPDPSDPGVPADVITFTALVFNAQTKVCEGGIDGLGQCCNANGQFFNSPFSRFECVTPYVGLTRDEQCTVKERWSRLIKRRNINVYRSHHPKGIRFRPSQQKPNGTNRTPSRERGSMRPAEPREVCRA